MDYRLRSPLLLKLASLETRGSDLSVVGEIRSSSLHEKTRRGSGRGEHLFLPLGFLPFLPTNRVMATRGIPSITACLAGRAFSARDSSTSLSFISSIARTSSPFHLRRAFVSVAIHGRSFGGQYLDKLTAMIFFFPIC